MNKAMLIFLFFTTVYASEDVTINRYELAALLLNQDCLQGFDSMNAKCVARYNRKDKMLYVTLTHRLSKKLYELQFLRNTLAVYVNDTIEDKSLDRTRIVVKDLDLDELDAEASKQLNKQPKTK